MVDLSIYETNSQVIDIGLNLDFDNIQSTPSYDKGITSKLETRTFDTN